MSKSKKKNTGGELLIRKDKWVNESEIQGNDEKVLTSATMIEAQEQIIKNFKPSSKIAFVSLCTSTRPYSKSRKWKHFIENIKSVDFIVCSNGGIIPMEYESQYPYMTYDAHGEKKFNKIYQIFIARNLIRFFTKIKYDYIVFNFSFKQRNKTASIWASQYLKSHGHIKDYSFAPSDEVYKKAQQEGFSKKGYSMYPDIYPTIFKDIKRQVQLFKKA